MKTLRHLHPLVIAVVFYGCTTFPTPVIDSLITLGIGEFLGRGITDSAKRTQVANYLDVAAVALQSVSTQQTPAQLTALISGFIPASVRAQYPEIMLAVTSIVIPVYETAYAKYSGNLTKLLGITNEIGVDVQAGAAPYISHS